MNALRSWSCCRFAERLASVSYRGDRSGFLTGRYTRANMPADGRVPLAGEDLEESTARRAVERNFRVVDAATVVAARRGRPIPQVALAWLLAAPGSPRRPFGRALSISLRSCSTQPTWSSAKKIDGCWRTPRRLPRPLLTACCVGKSASQMCLRFAAPGESNGAHSFALERSVSLFQSLDRVGF